MIHFNSYQIFILAGLLKKETPNNTVEKSNYDDLLSEDVTEDDLGVEEGKLYIIYNEAESSYKQFEWNLVNKDYIKQMEEENLKRANAENDPKAPVKSVSFYTICFLSLSNFCFFYSERNADELTKTKWKRLPRVKLLRQHSNPRASIWKALTLKNCSMKRKLLLNNFKLS